MRAPDHTRRVVVTGLGVISPVGNDRATAWSNLLNGVSGIREITKFDVSGYDQKAAGEVRDFAATEWMDPKAARRSEASLHYGVAAAKQALADSGFEITDAEPDRRRRRLRLRRRRPVADDRQLRQPAHERGPRTVSPDLHRQRPGRLVLRHDRHRDGGDRPQLVHRVGLLHRHHNVGRGGRGDPPRRLHRDHRRLDRDRRSWRSATPASATCAGWAIRGPASRSARSRRPFDLTRDGFVLGEGAASLFLEDLELAKARGARIYAEVVGYGSAADGWDMIQPVEGGAGSARAMKMALERRGVPADEIDMINPHGTSTPLGDKREAEAIWTVFGDHTPDIAISATKSMTGHMMGAAGAFEAFATVMSVAEQVVPGHHQLPRPGSGVRPHDLDRDAAPPDPLRAVQQHRPGRPQRRHHLRPLRRRLTGRPRRPGAARCAVRARRTVGAARAAQLITK